MAGIVSTTWVNGRFVETNVNLQSVLERNAQHEIFPPAAEQPPVFGILSQTVVESPVFHWILPARLGNAEDYDLAFIGDHTVELRRLTKQNRLIDVGRVTGIDSRIRNACIVDFHSLVDYNFGPQSIVLALENGELLFLFAHDQGPGSRITTVSYRYKVSRTLMSEQLGRHLAVDPSSRYLAVAGSENIFVVYALRPAEQLQSLYVSGNPICPVDGDGRYFHLEGVIHKMDFLFPSADDPDHVILLILICRSNSTRMHVFEWIAGQELTEIRSNNRKGHILPDMYRMPLLLIPLAFQSAFILVCEWGMAVCKSLLEGTPDTIAINTGVDPPTSIHSGLGVPLWTSWARPVRHQEWARSHDDIYIAREDGLVKFLEIDCEEFVQAQMNAGAFNCTIGSAFACLDSQDSEIQELFDHKLGPFGDLLITSGDSSTGGMYLVRAREAARFIGPVPNWSPISDFVSTRIDQGWEFRDKRLRKGGYQLPMPERIFACTGRGQNGAITEIQSGIEAELWLDIADLEFPIYAVWVLPAEPSRNKENQKYSSSVFLVSAASHSSLLQLEGYGDTYDAISGITNVTQSSTWLDLSSRTIVAAFDNNNVVQITEKGIYVSASPMVFDPQTRSSSAHVSDCAPDETIVAGALYENTLALIVCQNEGGEIRAVLISLPFGKPLAGMKIDNDEGQFRVLHEFIPPGQYPTCISLVKLSENVLYAVFGASESNTTAHVDNTRHNRSVSGIYMLRLDLNRGFMDRHPKAVTWEVEYSELSYDIPDTCVSVVFLSSDVMDNENVRILLAGFRSGFLVVIRYILSEDGDFQAISTVSRLIGTTPVTVSRDANHPLSALISCESKLYRLVLDSDSSTRMTRAWILGGQGAVLLHQPPVDQIVPFLRASLIISGKRLLAVRFGLNLNNHTIPRQMAVRGSATRILYSARLCALIVAIYIEGNPTLKFVDPESGESLGISFDKPAEKKGKVTRFSSGLGHFGDKILSVIEWNWKERNEEYSFLVIGTSTGRFLMIKADREEYDQLVPSTKNIRYWTHFKYRYAEPVSALLALNDHLFCCVGDTVQLGIFDLATETFKTIAEQKLPSRGISMSVEKHLLNVLTSKDSLVSFVLKDGKLLPDHLDAAARSGLDHLSSTVMDENSHEEYRLALVSDKDCSVTGLLDHKTGHVAVPREFSTVFEAELPVSITRFRRGRTRTGWDSSWKSKHPRGVVRFGSSSPDVLGIGIDGSIRHFTILQESLWRLLRFVQDIACQSRLICSVPSDRVAHSHKRPDRKQRHIDGDILKRCVKPPCLEQLMTSEAEDLDWDTRTERIEEFQRLVVEWADDDRKSRLAERGNIAYCYTEVYMVLNDLLCPKL